MRRRELIRSGLLLAAGSTLDVAGSPAAIADSPAAQLTSQDPRQPEGGAAQRRYWLQMLDRVCHPVLDALSRGKLHAEMPVESARGHEQDRRRVTYLEALGRTLSGIAPWLEHGGRTGAEGDLRAHYCEMARQAITVGVDKQSPDYLNFGIDRQTIVDTAFLALSILRAPTELGSKLSPATHARLADGLRATRDLLAGFNNWLLFAAMIEACLHQLGESFDRARIDYALREHQGWYVGDGTYGDGSQFHWDYYNSFVIQPFLLTLMDVIGQQEPAWAAMAPAIRSRAQRYAVIQERMIAPDGTYPIVGRSIAYRCGAFHLLSEMSLRGALPESLVSEQVRCALTAVIRRTLEPVGTFDKKGWLQIGLAGHQPSLGETYISTGSLYLCTAAFLPLGLPAENAFWSGEAKPWSSQRLWQGNDLPADHAL